MGNLNGFDAEKIDPSVGFDIIPAGKYRACIAESEIKRTKAGTGEYLALTIQIVDGEYTNRNLWVNLNLKNPSLKAVQIAQAELSAICRAVGILRPDDSSALHGKVMEISVGIKKREDTGDLQNHVKGYKPIGETTKIETTASGGNDPAPW